jgi:hypothetical protein
VANDDRSSSDELADPRRRGSAFARDIPFGGERSGGNQRECSAEQEAAERNGSRLFHGVIYQ